MKQAGLISIDIIDETVSSEIPSEKKVEDLESRLSEIMANDEEQDLTRQTGDLTVYSYYFKSVGFWKMLIFVFFCFLNVFSSSFSRKIFHDFHVSLLMRYRYMVKMVD
jgi:hypothetical protein